MRSITDSKRPRFCERGHVLFELDHSVLKIVERTATSRFVFTNNGPLLKDCLSPEIVALLIE